MPKRKFLKIFVPSFVCLFFILYYSILFFSAKPQNIERDITHSLETITSGTLKFEHFSLSYFPTLRPSFEKVSLEGKDPVPFTLKADKVWFAFEFWGFLFGKANLSRMEIDGGELRIPTPSPADFETLDLLNTRIRAKMKSFKEIHADLQGDLEGVSRSLSAQLNLGMDPEKKLSWNTSWFNGDITVKDFPLGPFQNSFFASKNIEFKQGTFGGIFHIDKKDREPWLRVDGTSDLTQLIYESKNETSKLTSPTIDSHANFIWEWNPLEEQLAIKNLGMTSPLGRIQAGGRFFMATRELKDVRIRISDMRLESLVQYYPSFKEAVPFNLGFSGLSEIEMSSEGTLDHLSLHANWDLNSTLLNYGEYFSKPKDMPLSLTFDAILKDSSNLSGDFSVKLQEAGIKGTITDLNFKNGEGQLNILTNKFKISSWAPLLPSLKDYQMEGDIKILANMTGNLLQRPNEVKTMLNLTLEKTKLTKGGKSLSNIFLALDYSPLLLEVKEAQVQAEGESPILFSALIYDPLTAPHAKVAVNSAEFDPARFFSALESLTGSALPKGWRTFIDRTRRILNRVLPEGQKVRTFVMELENKNNELIVPKLQMEAYEGELRFNGSSQLEGDNAWKAEGEIDHLNLAKFYAREKNKKAAINGNFFLKGTLEGNKMDPDHWRDGLKGQGTFSATNGEFTTFSILKTAAEVQGLGILINRSPETTPFDDLRAEFRVEEGKIRTDKVDFLSRDVQANAEGEINLEGFLNYRIQGYLSWELAKDILSPLVGEKMMGTQEKSFGPIPLLLSGDLSQPELKTDPSKLAELTDNLAKQKVQKVLRNFLPEDVLFNRPKSS